MTSTLLWCFPTPPTPNQHLLCSLFVCQHVFIGLYAQLIEHVVAAPGVFCGVCRMLVFQWVVFPPQQDRRKLHPSSQNHPGQSYFLFNVFKSLMLSLSCTPGTPACTIRCRDHSGSAGHGHGVGWSRPRGSCAVRVDCETGVLRVCGWVGGLNGWWVAVGGGWVGQKLSESKIQTRCTVN